ncbi:MAG: hypothetical protein K2L51_04385, partial [Clostridiales bacterium]|nr:hypothetical protein [Clostridiales bacterium]
MDKGERAYIKAEELEGYLQRSAQAAEKRASVCAAYYPRTAAEAGYAPCVVTGSGAVVVTVSLALSAPKGANGIKLWLYAGENRAAYTAVTLPEGGTTCVTLFACAYPEAGGTPVRVCANEQGLIVDEMRVLAEGNGAAIEARRSGRVCDSLGNDIYTAWEENGTVYLRKHGSDARVNVV